MPVTFILGNKSCKRAWKFLLKTLPTTVCTDISFEIFDVLWQSTIFNSSTSFCSFENFYKYIQFCLLVYIICLIQISPLTTWISCRDNVAWLFNFFFYFFNTSGYWDRVQGSPWRINYRSTLQNYDGRHKVRLPPTVS